MFTSHEGQAVSRRLLQRVLLPAVPWSSLQSGADYDNRRECKPVCVCVCMRARVCMCEKGRASRDRYQTINSGSAGERNGG